MYCQLLEVSLFVICMLYIIHNNSDNGSGSGNYLA